MAVELKLVQKLAQQLVMTPQLQQAIKLLQLSHLDLEGLISAELQENPALEESPAEEERESEQAEQTKEQDKTRELATDKNSPLDWQDYLDSHSNAIHGSLTSEATRDDDEGFPSWENTLTRTETLQDHLVWQLRLSGLNESEETIGLHIIGNLDDRGYVDLTLDELCRATGAVSEEAERVLKRVQLFDPVGVAARDLRECLLIQLENLGLGTL
jgi:RNA polymerase sigma-54 factor